MSDESASPSLPDPYASLDLPDNDQESAGFPTVDVTPASLTDPHQQEQPTTSMRPPFERPPMPVKRKRRNSKRSLEDPEKRNLSLSIDFSDTDQQMFSTEGNTAAPSDADPIVSPVVFDPSTFKKKRHYAHRGHHDKASSSNKSQENIDDKKGQTKSDVDDKDGKKEESDQNRSKGEDEIGVELDQSSTVPKSSNTEESSEAPSTSKTGINNMNSQKFRYGNYNRYYGKRIPIINKPQSKESPTRSSRKWRREGKEDEETDPRLGHLEEEWFKDKLVLDVGCNIGLVTLYVAKNLAPKMITGLDIDQHLIGVARKNIRHYVDNESDQEKLSSSQIKRTKMPPVQYFERKYGPLNAPTLPSSTEAGSSDQKPTGFPNNVMFKTANYVPADDATLEMVQPEYDTILALSITKWIHLNWGDTGLKLFFKRLYKNLKPGGLVLLEAQTFVSYKKRSKLTPEIYANFQQIKFFPDEFNTYLLSDEVGFESCELIANPRHKAKGFRRPLYLLKKKSE